MTHWKWILQRIGLLLFALLLLEVICALVHETLPSRFDNGKRIVSLYIGEEPEVPAGLASHPYLLYQNAPGYEALGFRQHNSAGYRNGEFDAKKKPGALRILALGGSTTYMFPFIPDPSHTWVAQLESMLRTGHGKDIEVINAGLTYATSAELLSSYVFRHRHLRPDILVLHTGGNDIIPLLFPDYDPEYQRFRTHGIGILPRRFEPELLSWSRTARLIYATWLNSTPTVYRESPYGLRKLDRQEALARVRANDSPGFRRNLDSLIRLAKADGIEVILFGFLQAKEQYLSRGRRDLVGLERALILGLEKHHRIMAELAAEHGVAFVAPDPNRFEDSWFMDNCHLNEQGERMKAKILYEHLDRDAGRYLARRH